MEEARMVAAILFGMLLQTALQATLLILQSQSLVKSANFPLSYKQSGLVIISEYIPRNWYSIGSGNGAQKALPGPSGVVQTRTPWPSGKIQWHHKGQ